MSVRLPTNAESRAALTCVLPGLFVAAILAPKDSFFLSNLGFYWGSQLGVLAIVLPFRPRSAIVAGIAVALSAYLGAYGAWVFTRTPPAAMAWLGYFISLPGAVVGALAVTVLLRRRLALRPQLAGAVAAGVVLSGILLNQVLVCSTVMYCGAT